MGTSSKWTATDTAAWRRARDVFDNPDADIADKVESAADALADDDPSLNEPTGDRPLFDIDTMRPRPRPRPSGISDGPGGLGGVPTVSGHSGKTDSSDSGTGRKGGRRAIVRGASRGGAAIAAAYAFSVGDSGTLSDDYGLDLEELRNLTVRERADRIADAIIGDAGTPDEALLKRTVRDHVLRIVGDDGTADAPDAALKGFIGDYVASMVMAELTSEAAERNMSKDTVAATEKKMRTLIKIRAKGLPVAVQGVVSGREMQIAAERLAKDMLAVLRSEIDEVA